MRVRGATFVVIVGVVRLLVDAWHSDLKRQTSRAEVGESARLRYLAKICRLAVT